MARRKASAKSTPGGLSFGNKHIKFVGDDAETPPVPEGGGKKFVPNTRLDWLHDDQGPVSETAVDLRPVPRSSFSSLDWVWYSCVQCRNVIHAVHFWAIRGSCSHPYSGDAGREAFERFCESLVVNPWI